MSETGNTKSSFTLGKITEPSITNAKGIEIKVGDIVITKGSKVQRVVRAIMRGQANGQRLDHSIVANSTWMNPDKLTVLGSVL